jgi:hypothetical protein
MPLRLQQPAAQPPAPLGSVALAAFTTPTAAMVSGLFLCAQPAQRSPVMTRFLHVGQGQATQPHHTTQSSAQRALSSVVPS